MHHSREEGSGREDYAIGGQPGAISQLHSDNPPAIEDDPGHLGFDEIKRRVRLQASPHGCGIAMDIDLGPGGLNRQTLSGVESAELKCRGICHTGHQAAESVDLSNQAALGQASDRRVAGEPPHMRERKGDQGCRLPQTCGCRCRFTAGMPRTDDDDGIGRAHLAR